MAQTSATLFAEGKDKPGTQATSTSSVGETGTGVLKRVEIRP